MAYLPKSFSSYNFLNFAGIDKEMIQPKEYLAYLTSTIFEGNTSDMYINNLRHQYIDKLKTISKDDKTTQGLFGYELITIIKKQLEAIDSGSI